MKNMIDLFGVFVVSITFVSCAQVPEGSVQVEPAKEMMGEWEVSHRTANAGGGGPFGGFDMSVEGMVEDTHLMMLGMINPKVRISEDKFTFRALGQENSNSYKVYKLPETKYKDVYKITGVKNNLIYYYPKKKLLCFPELLETKGMKTPVWMAKKGAESDQSFGVISF